MEEIIHLHSRDGDDNYLRRLRRANGEESRTYVIKAYVPAFKVGYIDGGKKFLSLMGGIMLVEGELLEEAGAVVSSIDFTEGYGYTVTFEK